MRKISDIYEALTNGDSYTDEEAIALRNTFKDAADACFKLGSTFKLAFVVANSRYLYLCDVCKARNIVDTKVS